MRRWVGALRAAATVASGPCLESGGFRTRFDFGSRDAASWFPGHMAKGESPVTAGRALPVAASGRYAQRTLCCRAAADAGLPAACRLPRRSARRSHILRYRALLCPAAKCFQLLSHSSSTGPLHSIQTASRPPAFSSTRCSRAVPPSGYHGLSSVMPLSCTGPAIPKMVPPVFHSVPYQSPTPFSSTSAPAHSHSFTPFWSLYPYPFVHEVVCSQPHNPPNQPTCPCFFYDLLQHAVASAPL